MQDAEIPSGGGPIQSPLRCQKIPPHRILVVEDDPSIRRLNAELLLRSGYVVETAGDGADAWDVLGSSQFDLVITDHNMPKVSGVELMDKLHGARMALPIILATGAYPHDEFARHPWLQPPATLLKPYTAETMLKTVKDLLCGGTVARGDAATVPHGQGDGSSGGLRS